MKSTWKRFRYRLEYLGMRFIAGCVPRLPRAACLALAHVLGELYYRFDARTRAVALENLRVCFADGLSAPERERIARASFRNFGRAMLDLFWVRRLTPQNYTRYMKMEGMAEARALQAKHGGIIFVVMHHGSYEWLSLGTAYAGLPVWIVAMDFKNPALEAVFGEVRSHSGHRIINRHQSMLRLLRAVRRNGGVGLLIDLALSLDHPGEVIDAFGMKMHVTFLHALLHQRTGVPLVPLTNVPHADGTCTITAHPPLNFAPGATRRDIVQGCWDFFEPMIRARPDLWLWSYRHWRNKPEGTTREYPDYAHVSPKFERALAGERTSPRQKPAATADPLPAADAV
jgi:KDO2-lipid IV(A) lauroyltransferase